MSDPLHDDGVILLHQEHERTLQRYALLVGKSLQEIMLDEAKQFTRALIRSMPPHRTPWQSDNSSHAKRRAERRVARVLRRLFIPKDLVGSRRITHLFGNQGVQGSPWVVPAPERHIDVDGIYDREKSEIWQGGENTYQRMKSGKVRYVDRRKFNRLQKREWAKIGSLAAGYVPAANKFGADAPPWIRRHQVAGAARTDFGEHVLRILVVNAHPKAGRSGRYQRLADLAVRARIESMERQIPHLLRRHERLVSGS